MALPHEIGWANEVESLTERAIGVFDNFRLGSKVKDMMTVPKRDVLEGEDLVDVDLAASLAQETIGIQRVLCDLIRFVSHLEWWR